MTSPPSLVQYVPLKDIHPAQHRFASKNVEDKIRKFENYGFHYEGARTFFHFDEGKSLLPEKNALPVIQTQEGYILCDGHHSALASLSLKAKTLPIRIFYVCPTPVGEKFWLWAETHNYAYLIDKEGKRGIPPFHLSDLEDDPLRYFASITAQKDEISIRQPGEGSPYLLWLKRGKDVPFIEMRIADKLRAHGFLYQYGDETQNLKSLIEQARRILICDPVPELKLLYTSKNMILSLLLTV